MVRIFESSRVPCAADALATSWYETNVPQPCSAETFVIAAVSVVLPWSTWPIVPTLQWGLLRSNFSLDIFLSSFACSRDYPINQRFSTEFFRRRCLEQLRTEMVPSYRSPAPG